MIAAIGLIGLIAFIAMILCALNDWDIVGQIMLAICMFCLSIFFMGTFIVGLIEVISHAIT